MSDDLTPDDPFTDELSARMHAAADHLDGTGVTRLGVDAAVGHRRRLRTRSMVVGAAAALVLLGGVAAVAATSGDDGAERISTAAPTTTDPDCGWVSGDITDPAGWIRLTPEQAMYLSTGAQGEFGDAVARPGRAYRITYAGLRMLGEHHTSNLGEQVFQLGYDDPANADLDYLSADGILTDEQQADLERRILPVLTRAQVEQVFERFPDVVAVRVGGTPMDWTDVRDSSGLLSQEQIDAIVEYQRSLLPDLTATTVAPAQVDEGSGQTPFEEWVEVLREAGVLTPEQEAEAAAGRGFALTSEQSRVLQEHWDAQAQSTTTTALADATTSTLAYGTTAPPRCGTPPTVAPGETTTPTARPTTTTTAQVTTTTLAGSDDPATTTTTLDPRRPAGAPEQVDADAVEEGDELWAVYLDTWTTPRVGSNSVATTTTPDGHDAVSLGEDRWWAAEGRAAALGYQSTLTDLACEQPVSGAGLFPPAVGGFQNWAVAVYFATEADARAFADLLPGTEAATSHIRFTCSR